jgi:two-component system LytT family response regulator
MGKILIVEDNQSTRDTLIRMVNEIDSSMEVLSTGYAGEALSFAGNNVITAFFLDIQLKDYSGLELAKQIREIKTYDFTPIVFITAMPTRELEAFRQIHCYDYIIKPFTEVELERVFRKILVDYATMHVGEKASKFSLNYKNHTQLIDLKDIVYIEYLNRRIFIHTKRDNIKYNHMPLKQVKSLLPDYFVQIHQSIIINSQYVTFIDLSRQILRLEGNDEPLSIGRSYIKRAGEII